MPNITEKKYWGIISVRQACIDNRLYTRGTCDDYDKMLSKVSQTHPTLENLYEVAADIAAHSVQQTVSNVMYILANEAVTTCYIVEGEEC